MDNRIPAAEVRQRYDLQQEIWPKGDLWHYHSHREYLRIFSDIRGRMTLPVSCILNIGSAGEDYGIEGKLHVHIDLSARHLPKTGSSLVADAHALPLSNECADLILTIGSVLNYCSADQFFGEVRRVAKVGALLIFDFEQSGAFEHIGNKNRNQASFLGLEPYDGAEEKIQFYSVNYINDLLNVNGFLTIERHFFHTISSLVYGLTKNEWLSIQAIRFDSLFNRIPIMRGGASNILVVARALPRSGKE